MATVDCIRCLGASLRKVWLLPRQSETDFEDFSFIRSWAFIGDSYAAGIGAGTKVDRKCPRYDISYPYFISLDDRLGIARFGRKWQNLACSGVTTSDVINKQASALDNDQQMVRTLLTCAELHPY